MLKCFDPSPIRYIVIYLGAARVQPATGQGCVVTPPHGYRVSAAGFDHLPHRPAKASLALPSDCGSHSTDCSRELAHLLPEVADLRSADGDHGPVSPIHGSYGYINEYEVTKLWRDFCVRRLCASTTEIMKDLAVGPMGYRR